MTPESYAFWVSFFDVMLVLVTAFVLFVICLVGYALWESRRNSKHKRTGGKNEQ